MVLPALRVLFTETIRRGKVALHGGRSRDQARQMTRSRSVAGGWQGSQVKEIKVVENIQNIILCISMSAVVIT
jgi:hypothetical protein